MNINIFVFIISFIILFIILYYTLSSIFFRRYDRLFSYILNNLLALSKGGKIKNIEYGEYEHFDNKLYMINYYFKKIYIKLMKLYLEINNTSFAINNTLSGVIQIDGNFKITRINSAAKELLNIDIDVLKKNIIYMTQNQDLISLIERSVKNNETFLKDFNFLKQSGKILSICISPVKLDSAVSCLENKVKVILFVNDVTESRNMEKMRREFVENVSHELKTPLTCISGFSDLVISGTVKDHDKIMDYLKKIKSESDRMSKLTDDILLLYDLENSFFSSDKKLVNISEIFNYVFEIFDFEIKKMNISYNVSGNAEFFADPYDMEKLIKNLVENSIKYNKNGGSIDISIYNRAEFLVMVIKDTGIGIPVKHHNRIFERFYRVDKSRSKNSGGTGLGLSIVKHIVIKYNGSIQLNSVEGKGTEIIVKLSTKSN